MQTNTRKWYFCTPEWFDHVEEDGDDNTWWDPATKTRKPRGTLRVTLQEKRQAYHARMFAQWASHKLAESAHRRGYEACRRAVMRLVAAWGEYGVYTASEDRILDAWYCGEEVSDRELAEEAKTFGYPRIAEILDPLAGDDWDDVGGIVSMHKRVHW